MCMLLCLKRCRHSSARLDVISNECKNRPCRWEGEEKTNFQFKFISRGVFVSSLHLSPICTESALSWQRVTHPWNINYSPTNPKKSETLSIAIFYKISLIDLINYVIFSCYGRGMRVQLHGKKKEAKASITSQARSFYIPFILHEHHVAVVATLVDQKKKPRKRLERTRYTRNRWRFIWRREKTASLNDIFTPQPSVEVYGV